MKQGLLQGKIAFAVLRIIQGEKKPILLKNIRKDEVEWIELFSELFMDSEI